MKFAYQAEKLSAARSCLMLPHLEGEASSIANAFHDCSLGFHNLNIQELDDNARMWVLKIKELMDTSGLIDTNGRGLWLVKAETFSFDQKLELSRTVNELASWFNMQSLEGY